MTIYILDNDPAKISEYLDDKSLGRMIKDIAQVLCNVHWLEHAMKYSPNSEHFDECEKNVPLKESNINKCEWSQWARECVVNYKYLVELGLACFTETVYRDINKRGLRQDKYGSVLKWARDNQPDLRITHTLYCMTIKSHIHADKYGRPMIHLCQGECGEKTPFPLVMPDKYITVDCPLGQEGQTPYTLSYRNYYQAKLEKRLNKCHKIHLLTPAEISNLEHECFYPSWTRREKPEWLLKG